MVNKFSMSCISGNIQDCGVTFFLACYFRKSKWNFLPDSQAYALYLYLNSNFMELGVNYIIPIFGLEAFLTAENSA